MYSQLDGIIKIPELVALCVEQGMPAVAVTDHGLANSSIRLYEEATKKKVKPIIGCLPAGEPVLTPTGPRPIESIEVGDLVLTHQGRFRRVTRTLRRDYEGYLYSVHLAKSSKPVRITEEHPILVRRRSGVLVWEPPTEVISGRPGRQGGVEHWNSYATFPKLEEVSDPVEIHVQAHLPHWLRADQKRIAKVQVRRSRYESTKLTWDNFGASVRLDGELAYFLGLYAAEGWVHTSRGELTGSFGLSFNAKEVDLANTCQSLLKERFHLESQRYLRPAKGSLEVRSCCVPLAFLLSSLCGRGAHGKKVPQEIFTSPSSIRHRFLDGLLDGDGKSDSRVRTLKVSSESLAYGAKLLSADRGQWVEIGHGAQGANSPFHKKGSYEYFTVPCQQSRRFSRTLEDDKNLYRPITKVTREMITAPVYNLEVEEDHSYVSTAALHNCEAYISPTDDHTLKEKLEGHPTQQCYHLTLLAMNFEGVKQLYKLSSLGHLEGFYYKPRVSLKLIEEIGKDLIVMGACAKGPISWNIREGQMEAAKEWAVRLRDSFKGRFWIEMMNHGLDWQTPLNGQLAIICESMNIPWVPTNDAHFLRRSDHYLHKVILALGMKETINTVSMNYPEECYVKSPQEMADLFGDEACRETLKIADMIDIKMELEKPHFPIYVVGDER